MLYGHSKKFWPFKPAFSPSSYQVWWFSAVLSGTLLAFSFITPKIVIASKAKKMVPTITIKYALRCVLGEIGLFIFICIQKIVIVVF